jgi:hypothetical protein
VQHFQGQFDHALSARNQRQSTRLFGRNQVNTRVDSSGRDLRCAFAPNSIREGADYALRTHSLPDVSRRRTGHRYGGPVVFAASRLFSLWLVWLLVVCRQGRRRTSYTWCLRRQTHLRVPEGQGWLTMCPVNLTLCRWERLSPVPRQRTSCAALFVTPVRPPLSRSILEVSAGD